MARKVSIKFKRDELKKIKITADCGELAIESIVKMYENCRTRRILQPQKFSKTHTGAIECHGLRRESLKRETCLSVLFHEYYKTFRRQMTKTAIPRG